MNACPSCHAELSLDDINVSEGVALCRACGKLSRLTDVVDGTIVSEALANTPFGCLWEDRGHEIIVQASARSVGTAAATLFAAVFWNSIVSVFVLIVATSLYARFVGPLPSWVPAPQGGTNMPLGMALFMCAFLTPFVLIGFLLIGSVLMSIGGMVRVTLVGDMGRVWTGFGPIGRTRHFSVSAVKRVAESSGRVKNEDGKSSVCIAIEADRTIKFASALPEERRAWMVAVLYTLLVRRDAR